MRLYPRNWFLVPVGAFAAISIAMQAAGTSAQGVPSPSPQASASPSTTVAPTAQASPPSIHSAINDLALESVPSSSEGVPTLRLTWSVNWSAPGEFNGAFEIERDRVQSGVSAAPGDFTIVATAAASSARLSPGHFSYEEAAAPGVQTCFRARTLLDGFLGPYTADVCIGVPAAAPGAPDTGQGEVGTATPSDRRPVVFLLGVALIGLASFLGIGVERLAAFRNRA